MPRAKAHESIRMLPVVALLHQRAGLAAETLGDRAVERALQRRMEATASQNFSAYVEKLENSSEEWNEFLEEVIVPETWFFRDVEPFDFLRQIAIEKIAHGANRVLRILSVPCASGEEPYSIAITLLEAGLKPADFHIDGLDISARMIGMAQRAAYRPKAFREVPPAIREKYFENAGELTRLKEPARDCVSFQRGNISDAGFLAGAVRYDLIFCRNLLIYFERPMRQRVTDTLERLLEKDGVLFTGHAEALQSISSHFEALPRARAFAYRKRSGDSNPVLKPILKSTHSSHVLLPATQPLGPGAMETPVEKPAVPARPRPLEAAEKMADAGRLAEAEPLLKALLQQDGANARAWFLLGMIHEAQGRIGEAETAFNKALYLDATNIDAMTHLSFLAEKRGDRSTAEQLKTRARRVSGRSSVRGGEA